MGQVAINWSICKGAVPIVGAKNVGQVRDNLGALGWRLTAAEVETLDAASLAVPTVLGVAVSALPVLVILSPIIFVFLAHYYGQ